LSDTATTQWDALNQPAWLDHLRAKGAEIVTAVAGLHVEFVGEVRLSVDGVPVALRWAGEEVTLDVGTQDGGGSMYSWTVPLSWLAPTPAPTPPAVA